jgi:AcrR family transcriptional regulator
MARSRAEETKEALVAAVIRLMDQRSVAEVTVKDIAAEAGVNHGLVHRYFGSKDNLVREPVVRTHEKVNQGRPAVGHSLWFYRLLMQQPEIARILARCCLDGPRDLLSLAEPPPELLESCVQPIREGLEKLGLAKLLDAHVLNAVGLAALLGWVVFRPLLESGFGLPKDTEEIGAQLARMADALMEGNLEHVILGAGQEPGGWS